jgi:defect-in-organelle-trafficking protein DotC
MREQAIYEAAYTVALQTSVKQRYTKINNVLESLDKELDNAFNFTPLMMYGNRLMPPIVTQAGSSFDLRDPKLAVGSDKTFRIFKDARIVTLAPSWRDYMYKDFGVIDDINSLLSPKDETEQQLWRNAVLKGWSEGQDQAHRIFKINLNRLMRDFNGVIQYLLLADQGVMSKPQLATGKYSVRESEDGQALDINQVVYRLTENAEFQDVNVWKIATSQLVEK